MDLNSRKPTRRSSKASIGSRNDLESGETNKEGSETEAAPHEKTSSIGYLDEDAIKKLREADDHLAHHVTNQLERIKRQDTSSRIHDEFEAQLDGA